MTNPTHSLRILGALLLGALPLGATTIYVDFGAVSARHSLGSADSNGNHWDYITGATDNNEDLIDVDGNATTIDLTMTSGFTGPGTYNGGLSAVATLGPPSGSGDFAFDAVTDDAIFLNTGNTGLLTLSGLSDSLTYDLSFYASRVTGSPRFTTYTVGGDSVELQTSGTDIASNGTDDWNDDTVVTLAGLSPTSGQIVVTITADDTAGAGGAATFGYINAMAIQAIPEPSTSCALALALSAGLLRRRRP